MRKIFIKEEEFSRERLAEELGVYIVDDEIPEEDCEPEIVDDVEIVIVKE